MSQTDNLIDEAEPNDESDSSKHSFVEQVVTETVSGHIVDPGDGTKIPATFKDLKDEDERRLKALEEGAMDGETVAEEELIDDIVSTYWVSAEDPDTGDTWEGDDLPGTEDLGLAFKRAVFIGYLGAIGFDNESMREAERMADRIEPGNR